MLTSQENVFVDSMKVLLLSCSLASLAGCRDERMDIPAPEARSIGSAGDAQFYLKEFQGRRLLIFDGCEANGVIEHIPADGKGAAGSSGGLEVKRIGGGAGDGALYQLKLDGVEYIYVDGFDSGGITRLSPQ